MLCRHVPKKVTEYEKQGFSAPDASWFKGDSIQYVKDRLYSEKARLYEYLDRETVVGLIEEHMDGKTNRRLLIWSLLNLEEWLNQYLPGKA
jgi:asparagine synthase (glutamine-hydrolysing)